MKSFRTHRGVIGAFMIALIAWFQAGQPLQAATVYWDINGSTAEASGTSSATGTWDGANAFWNNAAGTGTAAVWTGGNIGVFSAGTNATGVSTITIAGTQAIGGLGFEEGSVTLTGGMLQLTQHGTIDVAAGLTATLNTALSGGFDLTKTGAGELDLLADSTATLTGTMTVWGGTLKLSGNGALGGLSNFTLSNRGTVTLDNTTTNVGNRLSDSQFTSNGGTINFTHAGAAGTSYAETLGPLTLNAGSLTINTSQAVNGQSSILTIPAIGVRNAGSTIYLNGAGLGSSVSNQVIFTSAPALTNGVVPYIVVNNGTVTRLATHGGDGTALVPKTTGYTAGQASWLTAAIHALPTEDQNIGGTRLAFSLTLDNGINVEAGTSGSTDRLFTIGNGVIGIVLQTGGSSEIRNRTGTTADPVLDFGTAEGIFHTIGNLTLITSGGNNIRGSNGFIKSGPGTLTIQNNANTGIMRLNEGIYRATGSSTNALGGAAAGWEFNGGGLTLAHTANLNYVAAGAMTMNADTTITVDRSASGAGVVYGMPGALTIGSQVLTVAKGGLVTADSAYGLTLSNTAVGMTLVGSPTFVINNNGTAAGTLTVGSINSSGGLYSITKKGTGNLMMSGTTGFQNTVDVQAGQVGWSNNTATNTVIEGAQIHGVGGVLKTGVSTVTLTATNMYTGATTVAAGALQAVDGTGLPTDSNLVLNGGVFQTNGSFTRSLGTGAGQVQFGALGGGFAAAGGPLMVTFGGAPSPLVWGGTPSFVPTGGALMFGSGTADDVVTLTHNLDLNNTGTALSRTVTVTDNTALTTDKAVLAGVLSNSGAAGGITKTGNGVLELSGANTFTGPVTVTLGTLQFTTVTNDGSVPSNLGQGTDAILLGGGVLSYIGSSDLTMSRPLTLTAASTLDASGAGTLTYSGAITAFSGATGYEMRLSGTGLGVLSGVLTQAGTTVDLVKNGTGTWRIDTAQPGIADDIIISAGVLLLNVANAHDGDDLYIRNATLKLGVDGALTNAMDNLNISTETASGGILDINGTTGSAPVDIVLGNIAFSGSIIDSVGTGSISATGTFAFVNGTVYGSLTGAIPINKTSTTEVILYGANPGFTGATNLLEGGTLMLDYTLNNGEKLGNTALVTGSAGTLIMNGSATVASTETVGGLSLLGWTRVVVNNGSGQTATLNLGAITRAAVGDGTVDFYTSSPSATIQTTTVNTAGTILGGWATFGGTRFATVTGGSIGAATSVAANDVSAWVTGDHVLGNTGFTGTTAGTRTIGSLIFDANATSTVTVATGSRLNISTGGILVTSNTGATLASITGGTLVSGTGGELFVHQYNTGSEFVIGSMLAGTTALTKSGPGTLTLTGRNFASGQTTIQEGTLKVSGGDAIGDRSVVELRAYSGAVLDLNNGTETIGGLAGGGTVGGTVAIGTGTLTLNPSATQVYIGLLTGSGTLIKTGTSTQELEGSSSGFTGNVIINQGLFHLDAGAGALPNVLDYAINGPTSSLLSDQDGDDDIGRINNAAVITLNNTGGGNGLRIRNSNDQGEVRNETVGAITIGAGHNVLFVEAQHAAVNTTAKLTAASLTRQNQATVLMRGLNLGAAAGNRGTIIFTAAPTGAIGGGGVAGSTTMSLFPYIIGDVSSTGLGNSFVTYDATLGIRPLDFTTEYLSTEAGYNALTGVTTQNVRFAAQPAATLTGGSKTINSLVVDSTAEAITLTGGAADSLTLASGALLASTSTPANATRITGFASLRTGTAEYLVYTTNATQTLTIDSALATTAASLTKSGAGTLVLTNAGNSFSGGTWFNQGLVEAGVLTNLGTGALNFFGGGLRWGTGATFDISTRTVTLGLGGGTLDTNGNDVMLTSPIGNGGAGGLTKAGASTLTLNAAATYTGDTVINAGTLAYGVANALPTSTNVTLGVATLDLGAHAATLRSLTVAGNGFITGAAPLTITGDVINSGGSRVLTIDNSGGTTFNGSHLLLSESATARTFTLGGTGDVTINSIITDGPAAASNFTWAGTGKLTLTAANTHTGITTIDNGTVVMTADQDMVGALRFGSSTAVTTTGTLDLTNANATFGGTLTVITNSAAANTIIIGTGKTLTVNNNVSVSNATDGAISVLNMTGGGAFVVNGASFTVGNNTGSSVSSRSILDMSGLGAFTANLTGTFAVQLAGDNNSADTSTLVLSNGPNNITAATFGVGMSATGGVQTLTLGAAANVLRANTFNLGTGGRDGSNVTFGPNATGTLVIRDTAGTGRAAFNMGTGTATTGVAGSNTFDVRGHSADLLLGVVNIGTQPSRTGALNNTFSFDQGTLDMTSLNLGSKGSAGATVTTATFNIGGGAVASGPITMATTTTATGTVVANLNITGGNVTLSGSIVKGGGAGNDTANFLLSGNATVLDMGGFTLGGAGENALDSVVIEGGTIKNFSQFNGGGTLVKTTAGTLILDNTSYTGSTDVQEGKVIATGGGNNRLGMAGMSMGSGTASAVLQLGTAAGASDQTFTSLATVGTGTGNAIVSGNAAYSTLTITQSSNTTFNGRLGGPGANENNLNLVKNGVGELVIGGAATLTGTVAVNGGKVFFDGFAGAATTLTSLALVDGTEFSLRGSSPGTNSVYSFSGAGNVITVGTTTGATLGFALDGAYNTQLNLAAGQTMHVNGTLTTAIYVNGTPNAGQQYVLINGADDGSLFGSGSFNLNPVVFNGGSFTYALSQITVGAGEKWVLTPSAQAAAADVWWKGDLTGIGTGVWSASTTSGTGFPTNWDTTQTGGVDALVPPDSGSVVHFSANGAANFATTLGGNLTIRELIFHAGGTAISIGSSGGTNTLTLGNGTNPSGLTMMAGAPNVSFSSNLALAQAQAWNIASGASVLTLSGEVSGVGPLSINNDGTSSGQIILTGNGRMTYTGGTNLLAGWLRLEGGVDDRLPTTGALHMGTATQGAILELGDFSNGPSNTTIGSLSSGTSPNSSIFSGASTASTLTVNQTTNGTFHGVLGGGGGDQNNLNLVKGGSATLILNNANTYLGSTTVREGTLRLGAAGSITQSSTLAMLANAGTTATLDVNGRTVGITGGITLGGGDTLATARIIDTATGGVITLGGNILFDATNAPLGASITTNLNLGTASRLFTVDDSASAATDLTITGNITSGWASTTNGVALTLTGTGQGLLTGSITLFSGTGAGSSADLVKTGMGTWSYQGTLVTGDDLLVSAGTMNILPGSVLNVYDDVVVYNAGVVFNLGGDGTSATLPGGATTSNGLYVRLGAVVNILADNVLGPAMEYILLGDEDGGLGTLNVNDKTIAIPRIDLGFDAGDTGVIVGSGSITGLTTLNLYSGSIAANLLGVGNIIKDYLPVTLSGNNVLTGTTLVREGMLTLDFATNNGVDSKIGTGLLTLGASGLTDGKSGLTLSSNATAGSRQTIAGVTMTNGPAEISLVSNGGQDMVLSVTGPLSRTSGSLNLNLPTGATRVEYTGSTVNTNGIVGAWLTVNNSSFAAISGGQIVAVAATAQNDAALWTLNANVTNSGAGFSGTVGNCNIINSLTFDAAGASTITVADTLYVSSGGILVSGDVGANVSTITGGSLATGTAAGFIFHQNNTASTLTIDSSLIGGSTILKSGEGMVVLSGTNTTGAVTIDEGVLRLAGGKALSDTSAVNLRNVAGAALEITAGAANSETIGVLTAGSATSQVIIGSGATLTLNQTTAGTFIGIFTGAGSLAKTGTGVLTVQGNSTMTGGLIINQGRITMNGAAGALDNNNAYTLNGGELLDVQDQTAAFNRLSDTVAITLNNTAGTNGLWLQRTAANTTAAENTGAITVGAGHNVVTVEPGTGTGTDIATLADLVADTLNRTAANHGTLLVRGTNLGQVAAGVRRGFIRFDSGGQTAVNGFEVGGSGAAGAVNMSIIPWLVGDITATGLGSSFVTNVDTTTGLRPLTASEYTTNAAGFNGLANGAASSSNVRFDTSPGAALTSTATAINSLVLDSASGVALTGPANSLEITSGAILAANTGSHSIGGFTGLTTGGGRDYTVFVTNSATQNLTISASLTSAVPLVKSGLGILTLTGTANAFTDVYLNQGLVVANDLNNVGTGTLNFFGGGLRLPTGWTGDLSSKVWNIGSGGGTVDVSRVTTGTTWANGINDSTAGSGDTLTLITRSSSSTGLLTIQGASTFTGTTVFNHTSINSSTVTSVLLQGATNQTINGNVQIGSSGTLVAEMDVVVALGADEQIVDTASVTFISSSGEEAYLKLHGHTETVAGIAATSRGVIENFETAADQVAGNAKLIVNSSQDFSYTGYMRDRVSGTGGTLAFEKQGTGMQTLVGANITYTGPTTISGGTLRLNNATGFASNILNNAMLDLNLASGTWTFSRVISGTGAVTKTGAGTIAVGGASSYSGQTIIEQGVLSFGASNHLGDGSATNSIRIENNATLQSTGPNVDLGANRSLTMVGNGATVDVVGTSRLTASGALVGDECHTLTKVGDGALILANAGNGSSFTGPTQVNAGVVQVGAAGVGASGSGSVTLATGATLAGSGFVNGATVIGAGAVLQAGDVLAMGTAVTTTTDLRTLTFGASNVALTVQDGGQIRLGLGTAATFQSAGAANAMTLGTYTNALAYIAANGAEFTNNWNVASANATDMDFLNLTGTNSSVSIGNRITGTFGDGAVVVKGLSNAQAGQVFNLLDWKAVMGISGGFDTGSGNIYDAAGNVIAGDLDLGALGEGLAWDVSAFSQYGILVVVSVPEPSRAVLLLVGMLGMVLRRRRR